MTIAITVQAENPGTSAIKFRLFINGAVVATNLTAEEAHLIVGRSLQRLTRPKKPAMPKVNPAVFPSLSSARASRAAMG